jgi:hypothetical protein
MSVFSQWRRSKSPSLNSGITAIVIRISIRHRANDKRVSMYQVGDGSVAENAHAKK